MYIQISKTYQTRGGKIVKIIEENSRSSAGGDWRRPFVGSNGVRYTREGMTSEYYGVKTINDLESQVVVESTSSSDPFDGLFDGIFGSPRTKVVVVERPQPPQTTASGLAAIAAAGFLGVMARRR